MPVDIDLISKHIASLRLKTGLDALYPRSMEITQLPSRTNPLSASETEDVNPTEGHLKTLGRPPRALQYKTLHHDEAPPVDCLRRSRRLRQLRLP